MYWEEVSAMEESSIYTPLFVGIGEICTDFSLFTQFGALFPDI